MRVEAVIVSYCTRELLRACLESLRAQHGDALRVVHVIDNASTDGSADMVARDFPDVDLVRSPENLGFARAVNLGVASCSAPYLLLLNPDAVLAPDSLMALVRYLDENEDVAAVAPKVVHPHGRLKVLSAGRQPTIWRLVTHYSGLSRLSARNAAFEGINLLGGVHDDRPRDVEWVSGACVLLRRSAVEAVEGLSERWFMYAEDMDLCARLWDSGKRVVHLPAAHLTHVVGASSEAATGPASTMWVDSYKDYYRLRWNPGLLADTVWRVVLASGLLSRAAMYGLKALSRRGDFGVWRRESVKFAAYARCALRR